MAGAPNRLVPRWPPHPKPPHCEPAFVSVRPRVWQFCDGSIWFAKLDGSKTVEFKSGLVACGEPALIDANGRILLAFTALPSKGSDWRHLHIQDVTSILR